MGDYFSTSFEDVLNELKKLSEEDLAVLLDNYNIVDGSDEDKLRELADVISEEDIPNHSSGSNSISYEYNDVDDIAKFLSTSVDEYTIQQLFDQYACNNLVDLAIALTDSEIESLGYISKVEPVENIPSDNEYFDSEYHDNSEYDEELDYLEDIPHDVLYSLVDKHYDDHDGNGECALFACDSQDDFERFKESIDPVLVDNIKIINEGLDMGQCLFTVKPHEFNAKIAEEVVINDTLNPVIFDENHVMIPEVKDKIVNYVKQFAQKMTDQGVEDINYSDIHLIGSNAGYLYTPESDIDIHMISSSKLDEDKAQQLFNEFDIFENENPLYFGEHQVELGIEDGYDIALNNKDSRMYSLINDEWVNDSDKFENYKAEDINKVEGYEEIVDEYTNKINNAVDTDSYNEAVALKAEIRQNRSEDLANIGALSMGNVVFKELRSNGSFGKLKDYINSKEIQMLDE